MPISWRRSLVGGGLAPDGGLWADQDVGLDRVHIRFCGDGCLGFRFYSGSLLKSAKVSKTLLPHHSAPRLGSLCQRGLTGRPDQKQKRGGLRADRYFVSTPIQMWEGACPRWRCVSH